MQAIGKKRRVNKSGSVTQTKGDLLFYCCLLALPLLQLAIFYFGVNFQSFLLAFQRYDQGKFVFDISTNFQRFASEFKTPGFWRMVWNSFLVYLLTSLAGTVLAAFFSYYIYKKRTMSNFYKIVLFLPTILPAIMLIVVFKNFVSEAIPTFAKLINSSSDMKNVWGEPTSARFWVITLFTIWVSFGSQVLIYTGAMDQIPKEVLEAANLDGCTPTREFFSVILPYILPTVNTFLISGLAGLFSAQNNLFNFLSTGADPSEMTIGYYLYLMVYAGGESSYPYASFLGLFFTIIIMPFIFFLQKAVNRISR